MEILMVGSVGAGKSACLLRSFLNDARDEGAAPIVIDPKSELSRLCLRFTPPDCGKRVWFLDLGHPAFGMSPLRLRGERPLAIEAAAIAEDIVAALLDINANQIFQSSRRYLYHAVIGAIAHAVRQHRRPRLEDVYTLLRPAKDDFRAAVAEAFAAASSASGPDPDRTPGLDAASASSAPRRATMRSFMIVERSTPACSAACTIVYSPRTRLIQISYFSLGDKNRLPRRPFGPVPLTLDCNSLIGRSWTSPTGSQMRTDQRREVWREVRRKPVT
jgi:hypothetical protein